MKMEIHLHSLCILILIYLNLHLRAVLAADCKLPIFLQNSTWVDSDKGDLIFSATRMTGWNFSYADNKINYIWNCHNTTVDGFGITLVLRANDTHTYLHGTFRAFLCMQMSAITNHSYVYYMAWAEQTTYYWFNGERVTLKNEANYTKLTDLCLASNNASYPNEEEYHILVKKGYEKNARQVCPTTFFGRYQYAITDKQMNIACDFGSEVLDVCNDTQYMKVKPSTCSLKMAYSENGSVFCLYNLTTSSSNTIHTVYNEDMTVDSVNNYQFTCFVSSKATDGTITASQTPGSCKKGQTPDKQPVLPYDNSTFGNNLVLKLQEKCPQPNQQNQQNSSASGDNGLSAGVIAGITLSTIAFLALVALVILLCIWFKSKSRPESSKQCVIKKRPESKDTSTKIHKNPKTEEPKDTSTKNDKNSKTEEPKDTYASPVLEISKGTVGIEDIPHKRFPPWIIGRHGIAPTETKLTVDPSMSQGILRLLTPGPPDLERPPSHYKENTDIKRKLNVNEKKMAKGTLLEHNQSVELQLRTEANQQDFVQTSNMQTPADVEKKYKAILAKSLFTSQNANLTVPPTVSAKLIKQPNIFTEVSDKDDKTMNVNTANKTGNIEFSSSPYQRSLESSISIHFSDSTMTPVSLFTRTPEANPQSPLKFLPDKSVQYVDKQHLGKHKDAQDNFEKQHSGHSSRKSNFPDSPKRRSSNSPPEITLSEFSPRTPFDKTKTTLEELGVSNSKNNKRKKKSNRSRKCKSTNTLNKTGTFYTAKILPSDSLTMHDMDNIDRDTCISYHTKDTDVGICYDDDNVKARQKHYWSEQTPDSMHTDDSMLVKSYISKTPNDIQDVFSIEDINTTEDFQESTHSDESNDVRNKAEDGANCMITDSAELLEYKPISLAPLTVKTTTISKHKINHNPTKNGINGDYNTNVNHSLKTVRMNEPISSWPEKVNSVRSNPVKTPSEIYNVDFFLENETNLIKIDFHRIPMPNKEFSKTTTVSHDCKDVEKNGTKEDSYRDEYTDEESSDEQETPVAAISVRYGHHENDDADHMILKGYAPNLIAIKE